MRVARSFASPLGRLSVTVFDDEMAVSPRGDGMMTGEGGRVLAADETRLKGGGLEGSNVQPIVEMSKMIQVQRAYESAQQMLNNEHDRDLKAIETLTKTS